MIPKTTYDFLTKPTEYVNQPPTRNDEQLETLLKYAIPKNVLNKALGLWNYLKDRRGLLLDWDDHRVLVVKGITVRGSHLVDLLKHAVSALSNIEPVGYQQFKTVLEEMHAPTGFMAHKVNRQTGQGFVTGKTVNGPPGRKQKQFRWIPF